MLQCFQCIDLTEECADVGLSLHFCLSLHCLCFLFKLPFNRFLTKTYLFLLSSRAALSDRGTVVLEAAMASALSTLEHASAERSRAEAGCRGCAPCLFQNCGELSGSCCKNMIILRPSLHQSFISMFMTSRCPYLSNSFSFECLVRAQL